MKLDKDKNEVASLNGAFASLIVWLVVVAYTYIKADVFLKKKDVDIMQSLENKALSTADVFSNDRGLNFAIAFTAYDGETEPILDKKYGEIVFNEYKWGEDADGSFFAEYNRLPMHTCSAEELGTTGDDNSQATFFPLYPDRLAEVRTY